MTLRRMTWFVFGILLLLPGMAAATPPLCEVVCSPSESCDKTCWESPGGPVTTCGSWGSCNAGGCNPYYQPVSSTPVGAFSVDYVSPFMCEHVVVSVTTWHDILNCPGSSDYTTCGYYINATRDDHSCCFFYQCGGQTSC